MVMRSATALVFISICAVLWLGTNAALAQNSVAEFQKILGERVTFDETDFAALQQGQTVVKLLPVEDKKEVAVSGVVSLQVPADVFLRSYRESMVRKNNPAILEIGNFSNKPTLEDLKDLTFDARDIEDLKKCVVGHCQLKLSARMIERLQKEINWDTPDYPVQATQLLKLMLLDYVRDYLLRGDAALIEYSDKEKTVQLGEQQRALQASSSYINGVLTNSSQELKSSPKPKRSSVENAIVWSKVNFGLKPVIAINHITIYQNQNETGPRILIASRQIYANHYFDSSLALTAFVNIPGASPGSYLLYENRSRADGLEGAFGKLKRRIVEGKAVDGLKAILEQTKVNLNARAFSRTDSAPLADEQQSPRQWKVSGVYLFLWLFLITTIVALFALRPTTGKPASVEERPIKIKMFPAIKSQGKG